MWINQYLVKEKHKMIKIFEQFYKSKRPNIWVLIGGCFEWEAILQQ